MSLIHREAPSPAQIAANRSNGQSSQGPASREGNRRRKYARLKHGFYSQSFEEAMSCLGEDPRDFEALQKDLLDYWNPTDAFRRTLVRRLARVLWTQERGDRAQSGATVHQVETLERERDQQVQAVADRFDGEIAGFQELLDATPGGEFADGDKVRDAYNTGYSGQGLTVNRARVYRLLGRLGVPWYSSPHLPVAADAGEREALASELQTAIEQEMKGRLEARDAEIERVQASPAELSASLAPGAESVIMIRWQESLARQSERLVRLLSRLRDQDLLVKYRAATEVPEAERENETMRQATQI